METARNITGLAGELGVVRERLYKSRAETLPETWRL